MQYDNIPVSAIIFTFAFQVQKCYSWIKELVTELTKVAECVIMCIHFVKATETIFREACNGGVIVNR